MFPNVVLPSGFEVIEDAGWRKRVIVAEAGLTEILLKVGKVGVEHLAEVGEDILLLGGAVADILEEAKFVESENNPVEVD